MKQIHIQEKKQFKKLFKQEQIDNFEDRFKVLEAFLQTEKHVTIDELLKFLDQNGWQLDPDFVRETMKLTTVPFATNTAIWASIMTT
jgi:Fur family ferric uptake transcriptional regulator